MLWAAEPGNINEYEDFDEDEGITITATRHEKRLKDTPVITDVITGEEAANAGAVTAGDVLWNQGLMYWSNSQGDYVMLQGMGQGRVLYLIDGKRLIGRVGQRVNGETLPLGRLDRIEIVRGPQSLQYGSDAIGGVINFITKKPAASFGLSAGIKNRTLWSYNDPATEENPGPFDDFYPFREQIGTVSMDLPLGPLRTTLSLEGSRGDYYYNEEKSASIAGKYYRAGGRFDGVLPINSSVELRAGGSFLTMKNDDKTSAAGNLTQNEYYRAGGYLEAEFMPSAASSVTLGVYDNFYSRSNDSYSGSAASWTRGARDENENLAVFEALALYAGFPNLLLMGGFEAAYNSMTHYDFSKHVSVNREAVLIEAEYFQKGSYSILGGIRVERNSQFGFTAAPKVSAMYYLDERFRVFGGAGVGYRVPSFNELYRDYQSSATARDRYVIEPNTDIRPEYALSFNAGAEYAGPRGFFQMNAFYTELFNEIVTVDSGRTRMIDGRVYRVDVRENRERSLRTGVNIDGKVRFPAYLFASAGYGSLFGWNHGDSVEIHDYPAHTGKIRLGFDMKSHEDVPGVNTYIQGSFFSPRGDGRYDDDDPRWTVDFHFNLSLGKHFKIHVSLNNITGNIYRFGPDYGPVLTIGTDWKL